MILQIILLLVTMGSPNTYQQGSIPAGSISAPRAVAPQQLYSTTAEVKASAPKSKPKRTGPRRSDWDWDDTEENAGDVMPIGSPLLPLLLIAGVYASVQSRRKKYEDED